MLTMEGDEVRRAPLMRTVLSNGAGASAQVRLAWGETASQYDSLLSANPNPNVPADRLVLWTRTRCWLQREGYTRMFDRRCVTRFTADPAALMPAARFFAALAERELRRLAGE